MDQDTSRSPDLPQPLRAVVSGLKHLPGAEQAGKAAGGALDAIGAVSPRGRRMAVYAGAGVLGVAGLVEWPVAVTGAAVAWLTRPRPGHEPEAGPADGTGAHGARPAAETARTGSGDAPAADLGPGDRLESSRRRPGPPPAPTAHEQPAKVGDTATVSALKQVAEATAHHDPHHDTPHPARRPDGDAADGTGRHDG